MAVSTNFRPRHRKSTWWFELVRPAMRRRLPVYLLVDTSGSMWGERIAAVNNGLQSLISRLRQDPFALESVHIAIITFDREVKQVLPLTALEDLQLPEIVTPQSSPTNMGGARNAAGDDVEKSAGTTNAKGIGDPWCF